MVVFALAFLGIDPAGFWTAAHAQSSQQRIVYAVHHFWRAQGANGKVDAARRVRNLVLGTDPKVIDDATIQGVASLLAYKNDATRSWVAEALGYFGPRAQFASPQLFEILKERECMVAETSSESKVRDALQRIGTPAAEHKCDHYLVPK